MPTVFLSLGSLFSIAEREYKSFSFDASDRAAVRNVILAFCIGIILAAAYMLYQKKVPGAVIRAFLRAEAFSAESAKTPAELELASNPFYRFELKHNLTLKRFLCAAEPEQEADVTQTRYFIPEELKYRAELRYDKEGSGWFSLILTIVLTIGLGIAVIKLLPAVLSLFDNFIK